MQIILNAWYMTAGYSWRIVATSRSYFKKSMITAFNNPQISDVMVDILPWNHSLSAPLKLSLHCIMREILSSEDGSHSHTARLDLSLWWRKCHDVGAHTHTVNHLRITMSEEEDKQSELDSQFYSLKLQKKSKGQMDEDTDGVFSLSN